MNTIISWLKRNWFIFAGMLGGGIGGFLYWRFVGCASGTCAITGSPVLSTIWGALIIGLLLFAFFSKSRRQEKGARKNEKQKVKTEVAEEEEEEDY